MSKYILPIWLLFFAPTLWAQPGSTTEEAVNLEAIFIEANREKILENWDKAIVKFKEVLEEDRDNAAAAYELARCYEANNDLESAEKFARKASDWEPNNVWFKMFLAKLYQKINKDGDAASVYEELVQIEPENMDYYLQWAYYLVRDSKPEKAIEVYNQLESKVGVTEEVARHKHTLYIGLGQHDKAESELKALIQRFPRTLSYQHLLAVYYEQIGEKDKARKVYRKIIDIDPGDTRAQIALAEESKGTDDIRFLNSLKPVFEDPKTDIDTKIKEIIPYVGRLAETGDRNLGNVLLALTSVLETVHPDDAKSHAVLADVLYSNGQIDRALAQYKETLEIDDTRWAVWEQMLYILAEKKDFIQLVKSSEDAMDIFPNQATAYYLNGVGYNGKKEYADALASLQLAKSMSARQPQMRYNILVELGKTYHFLKKYDKSEEAFESALKITDTDPIGLKNYSYHLAARPDASEEVLMKAKQLATRLTEIAPNHPVGQSTMAFIYYKIKDHSTAKEWLDKSIQNGGDSDSVIMELYGDVLFQLGEETEALNYWQKALDLGGGSEFLEKKVSEGKFYE